jgi:hypothetical protein
VRAWVSSALSAFRRPLWSLSVCFVGGVSSGIVLRPPRCVPSRTIRPIFLFSACHCCSQSRRTSFFSLQSHGSSGSPAHSFTRSFRSTPGVVAGCSLARRLLFVRRKILPLIASLEDYFIFELISLFYPIPLQGILEIEAALVMWRSLNYFWYIARRG